ncbi:MAG: AAA family ATPase [Spirochaetes bacterium]|jgi:serine/threonine protein kinase/AraC-like DNA-binding protein/tetratricopeptide (TPR) repeat protein|nr:AAA family ATPase [Spirochaetota bacterium]
MEIIGQIINNRYRPAELLHEDSISILYRAFELPSDSECLVKLLKRENISSGYADIIRFRADINSVSRLSHEGIARVMECGEYLDRIYIAMEPLRPVFLGDIKGRMETAAAIECAMKLSSALECAHKNGLLHRHINPWSVLAVDGGYKIIDFGLSHVIEFRETPQKTDMDRFFGCISPEQSGLIKRPVDERSDLYSLGVILYRLLTGLKPFTGDDVFTILSQHLSRQPEPPASLDPDVPPALSNMIMKLLEKNPDDRYQTSTGLIFDLKKLTEGWKEFIPGLNDVTSKFSFRSRMIGREKDLGLLKRIYGESAQGKGGACIINGEAGSGKTRLAEELRDHVYSEGGLLIEGKCFAGENKIPFEPFMEALSSYIRNFRRYSESRKNEIRGGLSGEMSYIGKTISRLNPLAGELLPSPAPGQHHAPEKSNIRFKSNVGNLFLKIGDMEKGLVIVIDDLQWADDGTMDVFEEMLETIGDRRVMLVGTCRHDELPERHRLTRLMKEKSGMIFSINLSPLDPAQTAELVSLLIYEKKENLGEIVKHIHSRSGGNPFIAIEVLKQMISGGALFYRDDRWNLNRKALGREDLSGTEINLIISRIGLLDENEKKLLSYAAVIGRKFDLDLLFRLWGTGGPEAYPIVEKALSLQILVLDPLEKGKIFFVHDRIKEAFYSFIPSKERTRLHIDIAGSLESVYGEKLVDMIFDLAHHYIESGSAEKSIEYAIPAGRRAREMYAYDDAVRYFNRALAFLEKSGGDGDKILECKEELGGIYVTIGRTGEAIVLFNGILPLVKSGIQRAGIYMQLCDAYYRKGDWINCEENAARGLALLGLKIHTTRMGLWARILKELAVHVSHRLMPFLFVRSQENPDAEKYRMMVNIFEPLAMSYVLNDPIKFVWSNLYILNLSERKIGPSRELAKSLYAIGGLYMSIPLFGKAGAYLEKSLSIMRRLNYDWGTAKCLQLLGYRYEWMADFKSALETFRKSADIFMRLGDTKETAMALNGIEHCHYYMSDYKNAESINQRYYAISGKASDYYGIGASEIYSSQYYRETGDLDRADFHAERANRLSAEKKIPFNLCSSYIELGCNALERGETMKAIEHLEAAQQLNRENNFLRQYIKPFYYYLAQAYLEDYQKNRFMADGLSSGDLKRAGRASKRALRRMKNWRTHYGGALRVYAGYCAAVGNKKSAARYFQKAIRHCEKTGRAYEFARTYYDYGIFLTQNGEGAEAKKCFEASYAVFSEISSQLYVARLRDLLGIKGQDTETSIQRLVNKERTAYINRMEKEISFMQDVHAILGRVAGIALDLTGAGSCCLFTVPKGGGSLVPEITINMPDNAMRESAEALAVISLKSSKPVISGVSGVEDIPDTLKGKVVMCLPIKTGKTDLGSCFIANPSSGSFSQRDADFLQEFMSDIAVILENALLHSRLGQKSRDDRKQTVTPLTEEKIKKVISYINRHYTEDISRERLADMVGISPNHLGKFFMIYTGNKIGDYINELRIKSSLKRLKDSNENIIDIAYDTGFESLRTFNRAFLKVMKTTPKNFRYKNRI